MDTFVLLAMLVAAACHAGWNALLKLELEPLAALVLISVGAGVAAAPMAFLTGLPRLEAWPYIAGSLTVHVGYYFALTRAYRAGDLGQVYPIARGTAPLLTAFGSLLLLGEDLGVAGWCGIGLLTSGILALALRGSRRLSGLDRRAVGFALLTAATISTYTLIDGTGGRIAGSAHAYACWLMITDGLMVLVFGLVRLPTVVVPAFRRHWKLALGGGAMASAGYWTAIWAMSVAPIGVVAALRETSVLFAAMISVAVLREPLIWTRVAAAVLVTAGIMLVRLS